MAHTAVTGPPAPSEGPAVRRTAQFEQLTSAAEHLQLSSLDDPRDGGCAGGSVAVVGGVGVLIVLEVPAAGALVAEYLEPHVGGAGSGDGKGPGVEVG